MRTISLKILMSVSMALLFAMFTFTSCEEDEDKTDNGDQTLVEDGMYVRGEGTSFTELSVDGMLQTTRNEVIQEERTNLKETFVAIEGETEFNIVQVVGGESKLIGPGDDFAKVPENELTTNEPKEGIWRGSYTETETAFTVPDDGLYHVIIDTEVKKVAIAKVSYWGLIGGATPGGWGGDTKMEAASFGKDSMTFKVENAEIKSGDFKFRYGGGWKVVLDSTYEVDAENTGIRVNTNFGNAVGDLVPGGGNITNENPGVYKVSMTWSAGDGYSATMEKTGDISATDWTNIDLDVFGTGVSSSNSNAVDDPSDWGWGSAVPADGDPEVEGNVDEGAVFTYTWTDVTLTPSEGDGFAFRSVDGDTYNGSVWRYAIFNEMLSDTSTVQSTTNDFDDVNFNVTEEAGYDIKLEIDAGNKDSASVTIVKTGEPMFVWSIIGNAAEGWDTDVEMTTNDGGTTWTWTGDLKEGEFKFRKNYSWDVNYGDDDADGTLEQDGANIAVDAAGNYTIELNVEEWTYTITEN